MRPLWKGAVSFGLIYVPVKMYAATEKKDVKFNYLHEKCKTPVQYRKYCPYCETEVAQEEVVRGYEYEKGKFVVMKEEDFERLPGEKTRSVEILDFVDLGEIDPVFYDKAYYLAPGEGGQKVYELLKRAMGETKKVAVARVVIRSKEALAILRTAQNTLVMSTMFYPEEVRSPAMIDELGYRVELHDNEVKMAVNLVENLSSRFEPEKYTNRYREALMESIHAKITGQEVEAPAAPGADNVVDLMSALKASIDLAKKARTGGAETEKAPPAPARRRRSKAQ
ncbi:MAG: DNA repair protein [Peptococcaceae bacterium BICA1-7]|nr:MAG: DNA repair protein [Peptococcaceae bacterium BICA1-7]HBV98882.1 Ku protein [Desulfotomaculum sp.]